ncbi:MAG: hypothetical protein K0S75_1237 [Clostridia bacterium]|jgi:hypothetical protein|nr:hypothetical protein [Clostridia bacterium]
MWLANFIAAFMLLIFGLILRLFKAVNLISGYNTATAEERAKYDEEALSKFVGNMFIYSAVILFVGGTLSLAFAIPDYLTGVSWVTFVLIMLFGVIYMNTGNRFKKKA